MSYRVKKVELQGHVTPLSGCAIFLEFELQGAKAELALFALFWSSSCKGQNPSCARTPFLEFELQGAKPELQGAKSELRGPKVELQGSKSELQGPKVELQGAKSELQGAKIISHTEKPSYRLTRF